MIILYQYSTVHWIKLIKADIVEDNIHNRATKHIHTVKASYVLYFIYASTFLFSPVGNKST